MKLIKQSLLLSLLLLATSSFGASNLESGVAEVGKVIVEGMVKEDKSKIAIVDFSDLNQNVNNLGRYLAEKLINELLKNKKDKQYEVVERRQLNKVLQELKLSQSGLSDPSTIKEVGKILNVDALITGSLTDLGNDIDINARIISIETGKIITTASVKIPKVGSVATLMGQNKIKVSSGSSSSSSSATPSKTSSLPHGKYFFENEDILINYTKISKFAIGQSINMLVEYHNKTDKPLSIEIVSCYVTNDEGEKTKNRRDSIFSNNRTIIDPKRTLFSKVTLFSIRNGFMFNLKASYIINGKDVEVKIYDIPIK